MKAIKRANCSPCRYITNTTDVKTDKEGYSLKLKCPKCGSPLKLSAQWYARGMHEGKAIMQACGLLKKDAEDFIATCRLARRSGSILPGKEEVITWEDGLKCFETAEMKPATREFYSFVFRSLTKEFAGANLVDVTPNRLSNFALERKSQGLSARTIAGEIAAVKRLFTLVTANLSAKQYPRLHEAMLDIMKMKKPTVDNCKDDYFTPEEVKRMIASAPDHLALFIRIMIETGLRPGNVYSLSLSDIDNSGTITLPADRMKNGEPFVTSVSATLLLDIRKYAMKNGCRGYLFPSGDGHVHDMRSSWSTMCKTAGVTGTPHKLRHSFASIMLEQGVPLEVVSKLLAHSDLSITLKRYAHLANSKKMDTLKEYREKLGL